MFNQGKFNLEKFNVQFSTEFYTAPVSTEVAASTEFWYDKLGLPWVDVWNERENRTLTNTLRNVPANTVRQSGTLYNTLRNKTVFNKRR